MTFTDISKKKKKVNKQQQQQNQTNNNNNNNNKQTNNNKNPLQILFWTTLCTFNGCNLTQSPCLEELLS